MDRRQSVRQPWPLVLLIVLMCCAIAFGFGKLLSDSLKGTTFGSARSISIANLQDVQATSTGFVYYDGSVVSSIGSDGDVRWSYMMGGGAGFRATEYGVAAWAGDKLTLIDDSTGSTSFNGNMAYPVLGAHIGSRYTAVIIESAENESSILLLDGGGKQVSKIVLDNQTAVDYGFFADGTLLWVMVLDTNGTAPTCNIQTYRPGKEIVGSIHDNEQLSYAVLFQSTQVVVAGNTFLKTYDYSGTEDRSARRLIYGWKLADFDRHARDPLMALVVDAQCVGESDIKDVRLLRSDLDRVLRMPFGCMDVKAVGNTVYGFASDGHMVIYPADAPEAICYQFNLRIDRVYGVTGDGVAIVRSGDTVWLISLDGHA